MNYIYSIFKGITKKYTRKEVAKHHRLKDCWVILDNHVLDLTTYIHKHPGGSDRIIRYMGEDITGSFGSSHSEKMYDIALTFKIGEIKD